jgi:hypothetical protein
MVAQIAWTGLANMRPALFPALAAAALITTQAKAEVIYNFIGTHATGPAAAYGPLSLEMDVTDNTAIGGSLDFGWQKCAGPWDTFCVHTGSSNGLLGFTAGSLPLLEPGWGDGTVHVAFNPDTTIASAVIHERTGENWDVDFSTLGWPDWTMTYGADSSPGCSFADIPCTVSGYVTERFTDPVPEPGSIAIFAVGLMALAWPMWKRTRVV